MSVVSGTRVNLTPSGTFEESQPDWSPVSGDNRIAYISNRTGSTQVFTSLITLSTTPTLTSRVQVTSDSQVNNLLITYRAPKWSPNGIRLGFSSNQRDGSDFDVFFSRYQNGTWNTPENLTSGRFTLDDEFVAWDPEHVQTNQDYRIAFTSRDENQTGTRELYIRTRTSEGTGYTQTTVKPEWNNPAYGERHPDW